MPTQDPLHPGEPDHDLDDQSTRPPDWPGIPSPDERRADGGAPDRMPDVTDAQEELAREVEEERGAD